MPWYRIVPKTGNRKYLELPVGSVDERVLRTVKALSCWSTQRKPKNRKESLQESCDPVIFINKGENQKIRAYTIIRAISEYLKVHAELFIRAVESPRGVYVCFYTNKISCCGLKSIMEMIFNKILHPYFPDCRFQASIPTKIFSQFKNQDNCSRDYCIPPEKFSKKFSIDMPLLENEINDARNKISGASIDLSMLVLKTILEHLISNTTSNDQLIFSIIEKALHNCRYFREIIHISWNNAYRNKAIQNFLFSLGDVGKKYLIKNIFDIEIKKTIDNALQITPDRNPTEFNRLRVQTYDLLTFASHGEIKPLRCSKVSPPCGVWCGACSPVELLVEPDIRQGFIMLPSALSQSAEKFVQQLPQDRALFRRAELHTKLPKSMRSTYDVDQALSHLIAINYITPAKAAIKNFKPGKKSELFIINRPNPQQIFNIK